MNIYSKIIASKFVKRFRQRRADLLVRLLRTIPKCERIRILDVGGLPAWWRMSKVRKYYKSVDILNLRPIAVEKDGRVKSIVGDGCDLSRFKDKEYDVVFSNSVIEHVGSRKNMRRMAAEIRRVGKRYFIQTPNKHFFIDPHTIYLSLSFPFFQFLPKHLKFTLLKTTLFRYRSYQEIKDYIDGTDMISEKELRGLFPGCKIYRERFSGMVKSLIAYSGWD